MKEPRVDRIQFEAGINTGNPFDQVARAANQAGAEGFLVSEISLSAAGNPPKTSLEISYRRRSSPSTLLACLAGGVASGALMGLSRLLPTAIGTVFFVAIVGSFAFANARFLRGLEKGLKGENEARKAELEAWGRRLERDLLAIRTTGNYNVN